MVCQMNSHIFDLFSRLCFGPGISLCIVRIKSNGLFWLGAAAFLFLHRVCLNGVGKSAARHRQSLCMSVYFAQSLPILRKKRKSEEQKNKEETISLFLWNWDWDYRGPCQVLGMCVFYSALFRAEVRQTSNNNTTEAKCGGKKPTQTLLVWQEFLLLLVFTRNKGTHWDACTERRLKCLIIIFPRDIGLLCVCVMIWFLHDPTALQVPSQWSFWNFFQGCHKKVDVKTNKTVIW